MSDIPSIKKTTAFYAESVSVTILSLLAASMWIELSNKAISSIFANHPLALFLAAIGSTLLAIYGLKYLFSEKCDSDDKKQN